MSPPTASDCTDANTFQQFEEALSTADKIKGVADTVHSVERAFGDFAHNSTLDKFNGMAGGALANAGTAMGAVGVGMRMMKGGPAEAVPNASSLGQVERLVHTADLVKDVAGAADGLANMGGLVPEKFHEATGGVIKHVGNVLNAGKAAIKVAKAENDSEYNEAVREIVEETTNGVGAKATKVGTQGAVAGLAAASSAAGSAAQQATQVAVKSAWQRAGAAAGVSAANSGASSAVSIGTGLAAQRGAAAALAACSTVAGPAGIVSAVGDLAGGFAAKKAAETLDADKETAAIAGNAGGGVGAVGSGAAVGAVIAGPVGALVGAFVGGASCAIGKGVEYGMDAVKSHYREGTDFTVNIRMDKPETSFHGGKAGSNAAQLYELGLVSLELTSPWPAQVLRGYKGDVIVHTYKKMIVEFFDDKNISHGSVQWQLPGRHSMSYGGTNIAKLKITTLE